MDIKQGISDIRQSINDFLKQRNSIDTLFTKKIEDFILIEEQPLPIQVGKKTIFIGNLTLQTEQDFFIKWASLISLMAARICNFNVSTERKKDLLTKCDFSMLANGAWMLEFILKDKWFSKNLVSLLGHTILKQQAYYLDNSIDRKKLEWSNCSYSYFKKHITKEKLIQIGYLIYCYNFDSVKKNLFCLMQKMNVESLTETYIPFWLERCPGLSGKFSALHAPSPASVFNDSESVTVQEMKEEMKQELPNV